MSWGEIWAIVAFIGLLLVPMVFIDAVEADFAKRRDKLKRVYWELRMMATHLVAGTTGVWRIVVE